VIPHWRTIDSIAPSICRLAAPVLKGVRGLFSRLLFSALVSAVVLCVESCCVSNVERDMENERIVRELLALERCMLLDTFEVVVRSQNRAFCSVRFFEYDYECFCRRFEERVLYTPVALRVLYKLQSEILVEQRKLGEDSPRLEFSVEYPNWYFKLQPLQSGSFCDSDNSYGKDFESVLQVGRHVWRCK